MKLIANIVMSLFVAATAAPGLTRAHEGHEHSAHSADAMATSWTEGEVKKIDKAAGKVTLRHEEVKNLDMAAMTMAWFVKDPAMLDALKVGDHVMFVGEKVDGRFTVTAVKAGH